MANPSGPKTVSLSNLTVNEASPSERLGTVREVIDSIGTRKYVYVRAKTTLLKGYVCGRLSSATGQATGRVTPDISTTTTKHSKGYVVGVAVGVLSTSNYGWLQFEGYNQHVKSDGGAGAGSPLTWVADMVCKSASSSIAAPRMFGFSRKADSGSIITSAHLFCGGLL